MRLTNLISLVTLCGFANGISRHVTESVAMSGFLDALLNGFGINMIVWCVFFIGMHQLRKLPLKQIATRGETAISLIALLLLTLPSALLCWIVTACYIGYFLFKLKNTKAYVSLIILLAVSLREPIAFLCLKLFALSVVSVDALLTVQLGSLLNVEIIANANRLMLSDFRRDVVILPGCSSLSNITLVLLMWLTIARLSSAKWLRKDVIVASILVATVVLINTLRLFIITIDQSAYDWLHSLYGGSIYTASLMAICLIITGACYAKKPTH